MKALENVAKLFEETFDATCYDGDESEFAWPIYGVNFQRLYYVTGPSSKGERAELAVWRHLQGQRERESVGTFWDWLEMMKR